MLATQDVHDRFYLSYVLFFLSSASVLIVPYTFILAIDYYLAVFPDFPQVSFFMTIGFNSGNLLATFITVWLAQYLRIYFRLYIFYTINFVSLCIVITLNGVCILETAQDVLSQSHKLLLAFIIIVNFACGISCGVLVSTLYAFASQIGPNYLNGTMTGTATAGLLASIFRIIAKAIGDAVGVSILSRMVSVNVYFGISALLQILGLALTLVMYKNPFTRRIMVKPKAPPKPIELPEKELSPGSENIETIVDMVKLEVSESTPVPESTPIPTEEKPTEPVPEMTSLEATMTSAEATPTPAPVTEEPLVEHPRKKFMASVKKWLETQWLLKFSSLGVFLSFFVSFALYPGLAVMMRSVYPSFQSSAWFTVTLLSMYTLGDCTGRWLSLLLSKGKLLIWVHHVWMLIPVVARLLFFLAFFLFIRYNPDVHDAVKLIFVCLLGFTSGLFGSICMMQGSRRALGTDHARRAGLIMTFWLNAGYVAGACSALLWGYLASLMPRG